MCLQALPGTMPNLSNRECRERRRYASTGHDLRLRGPNILALILDPMAQIVNIAVPLL